MKQLLNRLTAVLLTFAMVLSFGQVSVWAADNKTGLSVAEAEVSQPLQTTGKCGPNAKWNYDQKSNTVTITGSGAITEFDVLSEEGMKDFDWGELGDLSEDTLPDDLGDLGDIGFDDLNPDDFELDEDLLGGLGDLFEELSNSIQWKMMMEVDKVVIQKGITKIGDDAFTMWMAMTKAEIPDTVTAIGARAFNACPVSGVVIPKSVKTIGTNAFGYMDMEGLVTMPLSMTLGKPFEIKGYRGSAAESYAKKHKSAEVKFTALDQTTLSAPVLTSVSNTSSGVKLSWKKVSGADGYYVYRDGKQVKKVTKGTSFTDTGAKKNGKKCVYQVYAYQGSKKSKVSSKKIAYYLSAPTLKSVTAPKKGTFQAVIKSRNSKAKGYLFQYSEKSNFSGAKSVWNGSNTKLNRTVSGLKKGKKYYVRVRAYQNISGSKKYSAWSGTKTVKIK